MKYSKENLELLVKDCTNLSDMVRKLNNTTKAHGSLVAYLKKKLIQHGIDFSHFNGKNWCKGLTNPTYLAYNKEDFIKKFLILNSPFIRTSNLKAKLIKFGLKDYKCEDCGNNGIWNNKPLTLQLDHEDGNNQNNELSNLKIKCPNCHTQTDTYAGKNNRKLPVD